MGIRLYTEVQLPASPSVRLEHSDRIVSLGSCFGEHMGEHLASVGMRVISNPMGISYNPISIVQGLDRLLEGRTFEEGDLFVHDGLYRSWMHHGSFARAEAELALEAMNAELLRGAEAIRSARWLIVTWGTALAYSLQETGQVVSNCHKMPARHFSRRLYSASELASLVRPTLERLLEINPEVQIVSTVSPIRHLKDGAHTNQLSKASLLWMDAELRRIAPDRMHYFPAYEIVLDELRDYRYYADDLTHPSSLAIRLVQERFAGWIASPEAQQISALAHKLRQEYMHRPLHSDHPDYELRRGQLMARIQGFLTQYPWADFSTWLEA